MVGTLRANLNENPYNPIRELKEAFLKSFEEIEINRYPDPDYRGLREAIARKTGLSPENVIVGNGSDELILYILMAYRDGGLPLVIPHPTFAVYEKLALLLGIKVEKVSLPEEDWSLPVEEMKRLASQGAIFFIGYPNNPTGNCWPRGQLEEIIRINTGVTVIDEAYHEFSGRTMLYLLSDVSNLVVLRTFSKAFGLAGARVGYAISSSKVIERINGVRLPFNMSSFSEKAALVMLEKEEWVKEKVKEILENREWLMSKLKELPFLRVYPSDANFILCKVLVPELDVLGFLESRGIEIRRPDIEGNYIRISVGTRRGVEFIWLALRELQRKLA